MGAGGGSNGAVGRAGGPVRFVFPPSLGPAVSRQRAALLANALGERLGQEVSIDVADSYDDLERRLLDGGADVGWAPPALCARLESSARAILKAVRAGRTVFHAALVGRAGEKLTPAAMWGLRAAWVDPRSTAGYLLPCAHLRREGVEPSEAFASQKFAGTYVEALRAVLDNEADVASVYAHSPDEAGARASMASLLGTEQVHLAPFAFTGPSPSDGLVLSGQLSPTAARALVFALQTWGGEGPPALLLEVCEATGFALAQPGEYPAAGAAPPTPREE